MESMIKIFTDSTTGIPLDLQTEYGIKVLPIRISLNGKEYLETGATKENFYDPLAKHRKPAKIIPPSASEIFAVFEEEVKKNNDVIAIFISTQLNDIYANAVKAKKDLMLVYPNANVVVIDSKTTCMQEGFAVLEAAELAQQGKPFNEIIPIVRDNIKHTRLFLVPKSFKYFEIAGLLKKHQVAMGNLFQLFPILFLKNGRIIMQNMIQSKNKAITKTMELFTNDQKDFKIEKAVVSHIEDFDRATKLAEQIRKVSDAEVYITEIEAVVGASLGPGTLGLAYSSPQELPPIDPKVETKI